MARSFSIPEYYKSSTVSFINKERREQDKRKQDLTPSIIDAGPVRFKIARHFGFCFGVENAIEIAYRALAENPEFWNEPQKAQKLMRERSQLETAFENINAISTDLSDTVELAELADMDGDAALLEEAATALKALQSKADSAELQALLSGEADGNDCFVEIHPGAGGTEAQDWAEMLLRMYVRWANSRGIAFTCISRLNDRIIAVR